MSETMTEEEEVDFHRARFLKFKQIKKTLREAGFPVLGDRFPYAMHHNFYRTKIRIAGRKCRHKDLSRLLDDWMETRSDEEDYFWQVVSGAVRDLLSNEPALVGRLPQAVRHGMMTVEDGHLFLRYAKSQDFRLILDDDVSKA
ncbi:hypothetical protein [Rhizobium sp. MHM7A]|uniref:hypothetical protein n=1 Tax=Rhizobium sp. MHM7A TaxID=2583233 RepID=UPI001105A0A2|nr:hypothetical protein [Rhizobium sp. MHM7A]TLX16858.1 hypothetical protein FFR93_05795 [Rhizobium sp. MHM7A]